MDTSDAPQLIEHIKHEINYTCYDTKWVPSSAKLCSIGIAPKGHGLVDVFELDNGKMNTVATLQTQEGLKCATFGASSFQDRSLAVANFKGNVQIYKLEKLSKFSKPCWEPKKGHDTPINCIDAVGGLNIGYAAPEIVTGSRDGVVKVWDERVDQAVVSLVPEAVNYYGTNKAFGNPQDASENDKKQLPSRDCWTVAFGGSYNNDERSVAAGYDNGDLKIFDLRMNKIVWETNLKNGVCCVEYDRKDIRPNKIVCTTLESRIILFDLKVEQTQNSESKSRDFQKHVFLTKKAHKSTIWGCRHLPQNRDICITTGGNGGLNLYKYHYPEKRKRTNFNGDVIGAVGSLELLNSKVISTQPIVSFDWNKDKQGLCCLTAMDQTVRVYIATNLHKY